MRQTDAQGNINDQMAKMHKLNTNMTKQIDDTSLKLNVKSEKIETLELTVVK